MQIITKNKVRASLASAPWRLTSAEAARDDSTSPRSSPGFPAPRCSSVDRREAGWNGRKTGGECGASLRGQSRRREGDRLEGKGELKTETMVGGRGSRMLKKKNYNKNGQDQEWVHQRDGAGGTVWRESVLGKSAARLRWFGRVPRKDAGCIGRRMLKMELPGKRKRGRHKRRSMDAVREDVTAVEVMEEDAEERTEWRRRIRCGDP